MGFGTYLFTCFAVMACIVWFFVARSARQGKQIDDAISKLENFTPGPFIRDQQRAFVVEQGERRVAVLERGEDSVYTRVFTIDKIVSVDVFEDGNSVMQTVRSSQVGGALVGGLLAGGVGAVVGGLSGKTTIKQKVNEVTLRIVVDDLRQPLCDIVLMTLECERSNPYYKAQSEIARKWHGIVSILIRRSEAQTKDRRAEAIAIGKVDLERTTTEPKGIELGQEAHAPLSSTSVADEIRKLKSLVDEGLISEKQFQEQRDRLLG